MSKAAGHLLGAGDTELFRDAASIRGKLGASGAAVSNNSVSLSQPLELKTEAASRLCGFCTSLPRIPTLFVNTE